MAVATTVKNSLGLATHRRKEGGTVLKIWKRTLVRSERQLYAKGLASGPAGQKGNRFGYVAFSVSGLRFQEVRPEP